MRVTAFRGYRYAIGRERDLTRVVAPPYDQISPPMQERLYAMSPDNIVRLSYPADRPGSGETADKYLRAHETLDRWLREGMWAREERPAIYPYTQTYHAAGREVTRTGFVALGQVTDYGQGIVLPHERTHTGPKQDRLRLLQATGADTGLLFMLTADPEGRVRAATAPAGEPIAEARDLRGEVHRLWRITDADAIAGIQALMAPATVIIADGHHRYETAVEYARRHPGSDDKLMAFFTLEAPGLTILANHRLVRDVAGFTWAHLREGARRWFDVATLADPLAFEPAPARIGVVAGAQAAALTLREDAAARVAWPAGTSAAWRRLAVSVLHEGLLRPLLGIDDASLEAGSHVDYTADQAEAVRAARESRCQAAFLIAPTTPAELQAVVRGGELLPQKSTHFYPKLLDGLVFHRM
ncbi:MAG TPA: DUF1015 domain-containing protein [Methylomirabilota bacterium]|nr:DUF1015 domain-containing protein [Methylomirabilota bacterium]